MQDRAMFPQVPRNLISCWEKLFPGISRGGFGQDFMKIKKTLEEIAEGDDRMVLEKDTFVQQKPEPEPCQW